MKLLTADLFIFTVIFRLYSHYENGNILLYSSESVSFTVYNMHNNSVVTI